MVHPHPNPLPQAGEGVGKTVALFSSPSRKRERRPERLSCSLSRLAGEGWGEGSEFDHAFALTC